MIIHTTQQRYDFINRYLQNKVRAEGVESASCKFCMDTGIVLIPMSTNFSVCQRCNTDVELIIPE